MKPWIRTLSVLAALVGLVTFAPGAGATKLPWHERPLVLPDQIPSARAALSSRSWIVGATPGRVAAVVARRHDARPLRAPGAFVVARSGARSLAADLDRRGRLLYAEPNVQLRSMSAFDDQLDKWARAAVVPPTLPAPAPGLVAVALVDAAVDSTHPDVGPQTRYLNAAPVAAAHGTMVASAVSGIAGNGGITGIYPGVPLLSYGLSTYSCDEVSDGVVTAAAQGATIINLSLGSEQDCFTLFRAVSLAYAAGSVVVAAAGNEFLEGNPVAYPAAYPHVLSVAAIAPDLRPSEFSNANTAVDLAAPGTAVPLATPVAFDTDGIPDGTTVADGTSFAAPIVAGVAAWLKAARPELRNGQLADVLRRTAVDVDARGYDPNTGFGLANLPAALAAAVPRLDPLEPNDGITFVDGTALGRPDPYVWRGAGIGRLRGASVDLVEDPVDVYRIRVPAKAAFKILMTPNFGDPDMAVYSGRARTLDNTDLIVGEAPRGPGHAESVGLINNSGSPRKAYVVVGVDAGSAGSLNASYRLDFLRQRRHRGL